MNNFLQQGLTKYLETTELSKIKNTKIPFHIINQDVNFLLIFLILLLFDLNM